MQAILVFSTFLPLPIRLLEARCVQRVSRRTEDSDATRCLKMQRVEIVIIFEQLTAVFTQQINDKAFRFLLSGAENDQLFADRKAARYAAFVRYANRYRQKF